VRPLAPIQPPGQGQNETPAKPISEMIDLAGVVLERDERYGAAQL